MKSQPLWSSTPAWRLPICKAPSSTSAWRLSIYKAPTPRHVRGSSSFPHGAPCVHQLPRWQFPHQSGVSKETWLSLIKPDDAHFASRSAHQDRRRSPHVPFGTTQEEFSFAIHRQVLLPALHYNFRHELQNSRATRDHGLRANQTTAHDKTSRARRQDLKTAPYQSTARHLH